MIKEKIEIPIFKGTLTVIKDKNLKYVERKYKTPCLDGYGAVTIKNEKKYRHYIVAFEYVDQGIIAHEIVHLVNYIFLDCGIHLDRQNDETQAYLTGWLFEKIHEIVKEK